MAKKTAFSFSHNPGMVFLLTYLALFAVNSIVLILANSFFPEQVVLGTHALSPMWAILHSMGTLALIGTLAIPFAREAERHLGRMLTTQEWMIKYFILNFVSIWIISRFSEQFGLGIRDWMVAAVLALALDVLQGVVMMSLEKVRVSHA